MGKILRPFNQMRRLRNEVEYPPTNLAPHVTPEDVLDDLEYAEALIDLAERVLDQMSPF